MSTLETATHADLQFAEKVFATLRRTLRGRPEAQDPLVIAAVGELQVRLAASRALHARASAAPARAVQARLAADAARHLADELQREWLDDEPSRRPAGPPLHTLRRQLGDHHLNAADLIE